MSESKVNDRELTSEKDAESKEEGNDQERKGTKVPAWNGKSAPRSKRPRSAKAL